VCNLRQIKNPCSFCLDTYNGEEGGGDLAGTADFDSPLVPPPPLGHAAAAAGLVHQGESVEGPHHPPVAGVHHALGVVALACKGMCWSFLSCEGAASAKAVAPPPSPRTELRMPAQGEVASQQSVVRGPKSAGLPKLCHAYFPTRTRFLPDADHPPPSPLTHLSWIP